MNAKERAELTEASKESRKTKVGPLKPKNYPTWAWLAGYLDGDGWFSDYPTDSGRKRQVRVGAVAHENDSSVLEFLQNSFGGEIKNHTSPKVKIWYRGLGPRNASFAMRFLPKLARHSRLKRHKIDQMISRHRQRLSASAPTGEAIV